MIKKKKQMLQLVQSEESKEGFPKGLAKAHKKEGGNAQVVTGLAEPQSYKLYCEREKAMSNKINENDALSTRLFTLAGIPNSSCCNTWIR